MNKPGAMEVAVVVSDLDRSEVFYQNLFGFERLGDFTTPVNSAVALSREGQVLKLIRYHETPDEKNPEGRALGLRFLTLEVEDIEKAMELCRKLGVTVVGQPMLFEPLSAPPEKPCRYVFIADPDGTRIEVRSGSPWAK